MAVCMYRICSHPIENFETDVMQVFTQYDSKTVSFNVTLPDESVINVNLTMQIIKHAFDERKAPTPSPRTTLGPLPPLPSLAPSSEDDNTEDIENIPVDTTSTTKVKRVDGANRPITPEEAIARFRLRLLRHEQDIGGYFQALAPVHRYFQLYFKEVEVNVRCTYITDRKKLDIVCVEYTYEVLGQKERKPRGGYILIKNASLLNQTLHMNIEGGDYLNNNNQY